MISSAFLTFSAVAVVLGGFAWRKSPTLVRGALRSAILRFIEILPRIACALLAAGFISKIAPADVIGHLIGYETGLKGILIATAFGGFTPAGPIVAFPIVVVLLNAGAGYPQVVAFLTAWSVFAFHRVMIYEAPLMGFRFVGVRLLSSMILPPIGGLIVWGLMELTGVLR
jgi:uncharacterized membrane protein YraQ (UPF0718 family)